MKKLLVLLLFTFMLFSCMNETVLEKHELTFIKADLKTYTVIMYDNNLQKEVIIPYSEKLFGCRFVYLYILKEHPTFIFYYLDGVYYSD